MTSLLDKKLLTPVQIGRLTLSHRIVMPALSRLRAQPGSGIPSELMLEYYSQRASSGGLIITEATAIAPSARGYYQAPGLYTKEQEAGWSRITERFTPRAVTCSPSFGTLAAQRTSRSQEPSQSRLPSTRPMRRHRMF